MASCASSEIPENRIPGEIVNNCLKHRSGTCLACQKLVDLESKISKARHALERLLDEKENMASLLNEHHDPFAHRLPVEIVSRIFVHGLPTLKWVETEDERYDKEQIFDAVFKPGHICRNWRGVTQRTPRLWTVVCLDINDVNCVLSVSIAHQWLRRSGNLPLFIQLSIEDVFNGPAFIATEKVISQLTLHAQRWKVLDLDILSRFLPSFSAALFNERLDRLDDLRLQIYNDYDETLSLNVAPRRLILRTSCFDQISQELMQLGKLTHFDGNMMRLSSWRMTGKRYETA